MSHEIRIVKMEPISEVRKHPYQGWCATFAATCEDGSVWPVTETARLKRDMLAKIADPSTLHGEPSGRRTQYVCLDRDGKLIGTMTKFYIGPNRAVAS